MFAVVAKSYGCARTDDPELSWTFEPNFVYPFRTMQEALANCDPVWDRIALYVDTVRQLETFQRNQAMGRKAKPPAQAESLSKAIAFVNIAATNDGLIGNNALHGRFQDRMLLTFDGQLAAGHPVEEDLSVCPNMEQLTKAIKHCGKSLVIAVTPNGKISIKGDKLKALVSCLPNEVLQSLFPDPMLCAADERIKDSFKICAALADENGEKLAFASVLLEAMQCTGTNGNAIIQHYHGHNLPPMVLPKVFADAVAKQTAPVVGLGFVFNQEGNVNSLTVWFEGGAWLKSLTYADPWPDVSGFWREANYVPVPEGLIEAGDIVSSYHEQRWVTFRDGELWSHRSNLVGAQYEVKGLTSSKQFAWKLVKKVAPWFDKMDATSYDDRMFFMGKDSGPPVRGIVMCINPGSIEEEAPEPTFAASMEGDDEPPQQGGWGAPSGGWGTSNVGTDDDVPFPG